MNQLYPIIRRQRRPLIVADAPPVVVITEATTEASLPPVVTEPVAATEEPMPSNAKNNSKREKR